MKSRPSVDPLACTGHGACAELFPEWIRPDGWGYPMVDRAPVPGGLLAFYRRAQAGVGGVSPGGTMLAMHAEGEMVIVAVSVQRSPSGGEPQPLLWIHAVTESFGTIRMQAVLLAR